MARTLSTFIEGRLTAQDAKGFFIVGIAMPTNPVYVTSLPYDVTVGGQVYSSSTHKLVALEPPVYDNGMDRAAYKIQFSDIAYTLENALADEGYGAPIFVKLGFFDGVHPKLDDFITVYEGFFDTMVRDIGDDRSTLTVQGASPMASLDATHSYWTTKDWVQNLDTADTSMDYIGLYTSQSLTLNWGKA